MSNSQSRAATRFELRRPTSLTLAFIALALFCFGAAAVSQVPASDAIGQGSESRDLLGDRGFRTTRPLQETLAQLQDRWLLLNSAVLQGDESLAKSSADDLRNNIESMGFESAPELSSAMAVRGLEASRQAEDAAAELSFALAEELAPGHSAVRFARARAAWEEGRYLASAKAQMDGYFASFRDPRFRRLALRNCLVWAMLSLLIAAAVFIGLQFATKGSLVLKNLGGSVPGPPLLGGVVAIALLLIPFFFPTPWLWVGFVWAVLLWGYVSVSERWALAACIVILGAVPSGFNFLAGSLPVELSREGRLLDSLEAAELRGLVLEELGQLAEDNPGDPAILQLIADVHQGVGQDDIARPYFSQVVEEEPINGAALNNLGVFHSRRRERVAAIAFLQSAADLSESEAVASYNLSRLYDQLLEFGNSQRYLRQAREASSGEVERWEEEGLLAVSKAGGIERIPEIRRDLAAQSSGSRDWFELLQPLILSLAVLLLAVVINWLGVGARRSGWHSENREETMLGVWTRRLVPGIRSAEAGDGGRAFAAILIPISICLWIPAGAFGYALPWSLEPGRAAIYLVTIVALTLFFSLRAARR